VCVVCSCLCSTWLLLVLLQLLLLLLQSLLLLLCLLLSTGHARVSSSYIQQLRVALTIQGSVMQMSFDALLIHGLGAPWFSGYDMCITLLADRQSKLKRLAVSDEKFQNQAAEPCFAFESGRIKAVQYCCSTKVAMTSRESPPSNMSSAFGRRHQAQCYMWGLAK
jgi:hypothetical protein